MVKDGRLLNLGCNIGINIDFKFEDGGMRVIRADGAHEIIPAKEWANAVKRFARQIDAFYRSSTPKVAIDEDDPTCEGWRAFWREWNMRLATERAAH